MSTQLKGLKLEMTNLMIQNDNLKRKEVILEREHKLLQRAIMSTAQQQQKTMLSQLLMQRLALQNEVKFLTKKKKQVDLMNEDLRKEKEVRLAQISDISFDLNKARTALTELQYKTKLV